MELTTEVQLQAITLAKTALEEGYRVIADRLNPILKSKNCPLIEAEEKQKTDSLRNAIRSFRRVLPVLANLHIDFSRDASEIEVWSLGHIDEKVDVFGRYSPFHSINLSQDVAILEDTAKFLEGNPRPRWTSKEWKEFIQIPIIEYQSAYLKYLEQLKDKLVIYNNNLANKFVYSDKQRLIMLALVGKAMTKEQLLNGPLKGMRISDFNKEIKVLKNKGFVVNKKGIKGYFRPDKPPVENTVV